MEVHEWPIDKVKPYARNPRNNDDAVTATAASIREFGWQQPIVVDKEGVIIVGHTRLKAAHKLGLAKVPVTVASGLTDEQVRAYRLADNKTGELAEWDFDLLNNELDDILDLDMSEFGFEDAFEDAPTTNPEDFKNDFLVPPFSVINTASGDMLRHKQYWMSIIEDDGSSRTIKQKTLDTSHMKGSTEASVSILNPALAELVCRWFLPLGRPAKTFDCFSGDPEFGFVSSYLGNQFTGIELRQQQVEFNQNLADSFKLDAHYINDDGQNVAKHIAAGSQDLLFSCPPYYDLEVYSDLENDASNQGTYEEFMQILRNAFSSAITCLKDNRFACVVVGDIRDRKTGAYYNFVDDVKHIFIDNGMPLYNEIILQDPLGTAPMRARKSMKGRKIVKIHQNLLVFYKGDASTIQEEFGIIEGFGEELQDES